MSRAILPQALLKGFARYHYWWPFVAKVILRDATAHRTLERVASDIGASQASVLVTYHSAHVVA